jgi:hypothetical protein
MSTSSVAPTPVTSGQAAKPNKLWADVNAVGEGIRKVNNVIATLVVKNLSQIKALNPLAATIAAQFAIGQELVDSKYAAVDATGVTGAKKFEEIMESVGPIILQQLAENGLVVEKASVQPVYNAFQAFVTSLSQLQGASTAAPSSDAIAAAEQAAGMPAPNASGAA